jgi:hypothetical protein
MSMGADDDKIQSMRNETAEDTPMQHQYIEAGDGRPYIAIDYTPEGIRHEHIERMAAVLLAGGDQRRTSTQEIHAAVNVARQIIEINRSK